MKPKSIIAVATLTTLCCIYLARLNEKVNAQFDPDTQSTAVFALSKNESSSDVGMSVGPERRMKVDLQSTVDSVFLMNGAIDNMIYGKEGTGLFFPANCFVDRSGNTVKGKVKIVLRECYDIATILAAKLSTTSEGQLLETAGMIDIQATSAGREVYIRDDGSYRIMFPKHENTKDDFELFYGEWKRDGIINWRLAEVDLSAVNEFYGSTEEGSKYDNIEMEYTTESAPVYQSKLNAGESCFLHICESKLRRGTRISEMDYFNWQLGNGQTLNQWFVENFNPDLQMLEDYCIQGLRSEITFKVNRSGGFESYYISKSAITEYDRKLVAFLQTMPPLNLKQLMPDYTDDHACILTFGSRQANEKEKFVSSFAKKCDADPNKVMTEVDESTLDYFIFSCSQLGWINCDRFYNSDDPLVDYVVEISGGGNTSVSMVFDELNSVLRGVSEGNKVVFHDVPANKKVRLVGIQYNEEAPLMCVTKSNTQNERTLLNAFKPFTIGELRGQFVKLE